MTLKEKMHISVGIKDFLQVLLLFRETPEGRVKGLRDAGAECEWCITLTGGAQKKSIWYLFSV